MCPFGKISEKKIFFSGKLQLFLLKVDPGHKFELSRELTQNGENLTENSNSSSNFTSKTYFIFIFFLTFFKTFLRYFQKW